MNRSPKTPRSVIAGVKEDTQFKAVEMRALDGAVELVWAKSMSGDRSWSDLAAECGLAVAADTRGKTLRKDVVSVIGLDSTAVAFYRISAPAVGEEETASIVRMQAESLLPLSPDQIEVAWRTMPSTDGQVDVTIAAARKDQLRRFIENTRDFHPRNILLSCEGMAQAWQNLFTDQEPQATIISIGERDTQICLVQMHHVVHAAVLDIGMGDLVQAGGHAGQADTSEEVERFAQDIRTILDSFGWEASTVWPILVLSDGGKATDAVVASLNASGLPARTSLPSTQDIKLPRNFEAHDIYQYRTALGLALLAMKEPSESLDLFGGIVEDQAQTQAKRARYSVILAGIVAAVMLAAFVATSYVVDRGRDRHYTSLLKQTDLDQARQRQSLLKTVAQHRADLLQLLTDISSGENSGIILDSFHFKKGQVVTLIGQTDNVEQLWKYQQNLRGRKGLKEVEISSANQDAKTKKIKFTITFQYKDFGKKTAVL
jgi:hypothetical protein